MILWFIWFGPEKKASMHRRRYKLRQRGGCQWRAVIANGKRVPLSTSPMKPIPAVTPWYTGVWTLYLAGNRQRYTILISWYNDRERAAGFSKKPQRRSVSVGPRDLFFFFAISFDLPPVAAAVFLSLQFRDLRASYIITRLSGCVCARYAGRTRYSNDVTEPFGRIVIHPRLLGIQY